MDKELISLGDGDIEEIAIVGLAGRFPGARNIEQYWENLRDGVESIIHFTDDELKAQGIPSERLDDSSFVKAGTVLDDFDKFDARFFGYNPSESESIDPQQRIFLETAWEALENAGYDPDIYKGPIGVYAGSNPNDYRNILNDDLKASDVAGVMERLIGNENDFLCTRVSYKLNLRGPSLTVQTGCSTSLVAVQLACQSLLTYQCSIALAGGVSINLRHSRGYYYQEGTILSPDGYCRAFDANAQGTVLGQAVGVVVLKRLSEALADGDQIYAVIKSSATNNDGALKAGYTAPSVDGQTEVIAMAQALGRVPANTISYIEAHGTGTPLGDPIEFASLVQAFRASTNKKGFCAIGSVKTNIGHTDAAAGIASLIKIILMLKHKQIPPSLHFEKPNPHMDFENSPFYVPVELLEWKVNGFPRRAGVSSFGIGGTNAHAILEEAPIVQPSGRSRPWQLLVLSAQTSRALDKITEGLRKYLKQKSDPNLADVAYTLQKGRKTFNHRRMIVCRDLDDAVKALENFDSSRVLTSYQEPTNQKVAFMFTGQGSQYVNMGLELYRNERVFREHIDRCSEILQPLLFLDLRDILYPSEGNLDEFTQKLKQTQIAQPALFTIEYALANLWMSWGVHPEAMVGHSIGEYVAASVSGVFALEDALRLVAARGRLMQELPGGSMLAVSLSEEEVQPFLGDGISLAAVNAPGLCVVSGKTDVVHEMEEQLVKQNIGCTHLHTSHAFHSEMMDSILDDYIDHFRGVKLNPPQIPIISTVKGRWITAEEITNPDYWAKNLRKTVRFSPCAKELLKESRILLEVGPGQTLTTLARQHLNRQNEQILLTSIRHPEEKKSDIAHILNTLGRLWMSGVQLDWLGFYAEERRHRVPLPTYPFERQRYWPAQHQSAHLPKIARKSQDTKRHMNEWFFTPSWKRSQVPNQPGRSALSDEKLSWLLFTDELGLGTGIADQLEQQGQDVISVHVGERFASPSPESYIINPQSKEDYEALIKELVTLGNPPQKIVHFWSVTPNVCAPSSIQSFDRFQDLGFFSLIFMVQALARNHVTQAIELQVVTNHVHEVTDEGDLLCPDKATVLGPCKVIPQEYANISCRNIDLSFESSKKKQLEQLLDEFTAKPVDPIVAYRGKHRWVQIFEPLQVKSTDETRPRLKEGGVYLITGGLGDIGLVLAEYLAKTVQARLILVARTSLPTRTEWEKWLETHGEMDDISSKIIKIRALEELGAEVLTTSADVADEDCMRGVIVEAEERFGEINGVIHAAGSFIEASIQDVNRDMCKNQFQSKVNGLFVLRRVLEGKNIDFCLLSSSLSTVLGGLGFATYAAANLFMDAFAQRHSQVGSGRWISVDWDAWQFQDKSGQHVVSKTDLTHSGDLGIKPEEGVEAVKRILSLDFGTQIVVSTGDLQARLDKWTKMEFLSESEQIETVETRSRYARPTLSSDYVGPGNAAEQTITEIWQQMLGIEKVGIHDNFFELGGHSLLATKVIARLRTAFPVEFPIASLFENPTVHLLSKMILNNHEPRPSFKESRKRGQKRKEKKLRSMVPKKGVQSYDALRSI